jgi:pimeloyl-ACP methyl ester carboxylesterase
MNLVQQVQSMPTLGCALPHRGFIRYREKTGKKNSTPIVLLHGIGSGSGSWVQQLASATALHLLAWDAPGYADSTALKPEQPSAKDYAEVLWAWLDALQIQQVHLVGHSLGCLMAAAAARLQAQRVVRLTLLAPAQGYGPAPAQVRRQKTQERLQAIQTLGLEKMAQQRAPRLLAPQASAEQIALAAHMMSHLNEGGYAQATQMLGGGDIRADLQAFRNASTAPITVACGEQDVITPPQACRDLAAFIGVPYVSLGDVGHLCALENPQTTQTLLETSHE